MMRGRKPTLKTLQLPAEDKARAPLKIPTCPPVLKGEAKAEWDRMAKLLFDLGIVACLDRTTLAVHCMAWQRWTEAEAAIAEQGPIVKSPSGYPIQNPNLSVANQAAKQMRELLSEFGLSPAARHRLLGAPKKSEQTKPSKWKGLLANAS